jgi:hypothetical protein
MQIVCPQCGKTGRVVWAESNDPVGRGRGDPQPTPKSLSPGFRTGPGTDEIGDPAVYCNDCKVPVGNS